MKVGGEVFSFFRKGAEGVRCVMHLNSQAKGPLLDRTLESFLINTAKGPLLDRTLESFLINTEGAIFHAGKNLSGKKTG